MWKNVMCGEREREREREGEKYTVNLPAMPVELPSCSFLIGQARVYASLIA